MFTVPPTAGTWTVRATLTADPQIIDDATVVADFRGGRLVDGWGPEGEGLWAHEVVETSQAADLVADAEHIYALIRHTAPPSATLVSLVEATGLGKPGFGSGGVRSYTAPGGVKIDPRQLGLAADRLYIQGQVVLDTVVSAATLDSGQPINDFGTHKSQYSMRGATPDPSSGTVYVGIDDFGVVGAERLFPNGDVDMTWGDAGKRLLAAPSAWKSTWDPGKELLVLRELEVDSSGRLYALLTSFDEANTGEVALVMRLDTSGALDPSFGLGGAALWAIDDQPGTDPKRMQITADGGIVVVGADYGQWFATRLTADGDLDLGWGDGGHVHHAYMRDIGSPASTAGVDVAVMPDGHVVFLINIEPASELTALVRYTQDGQVDLDFGDPEADGDGWSLIDTAPVRLAPGVDGRVFVLGQFTYSDSDVTISDAWINAVHTY
jgi:uncharacterized delta-60 repeat protein